MNHNFNNNVMNIDMNNFESERYLLLELLKDLGAQPYDMTWEELIFENEDLSRQFSTYIAYQKSIGQPIIPKNQKKVLCRNIAQGLKCPYGFNCKFSHNKEYIKPSFLNHKAKEFTPLIDINGIISLENLPTILNTFEEMKKESIDIVLNKIKCCKEKIYKNEVVSSESKMDFEHVVSESKMEIETVVVSETETKIEIDTPVSDVVEEELIKQFDKTLDQVIKEKPIEDDGICRGKVAKTGIRCTAPSKNGTLFCGRHKNYSAELMK